VVFNPPNLFAVQTFLGWPQVLLLLLLLLQVKMPLGAVLLHQSRLQLPETTFQHGPEQNLSHAQPDEG